MEAWFVGEIIGEGIGRTRREAQRLAAEGSIKNLANIYVSRCKAGSATAANDMNKFPSTNDNGTGKRLKLDFPRASSSARYSTNASVP